MALGNSIENISDARQAKYFADIFEIPRTLRSFDSQLCS